MGSPVPAAGGAGAGGLAFMFSFSPSFISRVFGFFASKKLRGLAGRISTWFYRRGGVGWSRVVWCFGIGSLFSYRKRNVLAAPGAAGLYGATAAALPGVVSLCI